MDYTLASLVLGLLILLAWGVAAWLALRWTWLLGWLKGSVIVGLFLVGVLLAAVVVDISSWSSAGNGRPVAHISVERKNANEAQVQISLVGGNHAEMTVPVMGDYLEIGFNTLRWQGVFNSIGLSSRPAWIRNHFDTLDGTRSNGSSADNPIPLPHSVSPIKLWELLQNEGAQSFLRSFVRAGSQRVDYIPLKDGALFELKFSDGKLLMEPLNETAQQASLP